MKRLILVIFIFAVGLVVFFVYQNKTAVAPTISPQTSSKVTATPVPQTGNLIFDSARITKKPFGIYITPATSPVQPTEILGPAEARPQETTPREKFTGYHTGADFETTSAEANIDVPVPAFCDGKLLEKKYATGYGGVAVQSCVLTIPPSPGSGEAKQAVTIIYGHLRLSSIASTVGQTLKKGDSLGILGKGYSTETDGERKHLHLGIHIGPTINILGYVQKQSDLSGWLDPIQFLK